MAGSMKSLLCKVWFWYGLAAVLVLVDQLSKQWASAVLVDGPIVFTSFFNFTLRHNTGAAFSFLADAGGWQRYFFAVLACVVSVVLAVWMARLPKGRQWESFALACVLGGAIGNLIDRVLLGHVVDFIVLHYQAHYWPAFNVADMAICCGAMVLLIDTFWGHKDGSPKSEPADN